MFWKNTNILKMKLTQRVNRIIVITIYLEKRKKEITKIYAVMIYKITNISAKIMY